MKIVTWNCNGALRNKFEKLSDLNADIYIIQECENPLLTSHNNYRKWASNHLWLGDNKNKGVGVFAGENILLEKLNWKNQFKDHHVKYFLPFSVDNLFNFLAVWTHRNNSPNFGYIGQFWKYLQVNKQHFKNIIIAGDFNSNSCWDQWDRWWNHSDVINELERINIYSLYHNTFNEKQGAESSPTFYQYRNLEKPYHIDYIFASAQLKEKVKSFSIGKIDSWLEISDHLPLICEFNS